MTELKKIMYGRSSVRRFLDKPVPEDLIYQVIDAGRVSPSPTNTQPWYFYVFSGKDIQYVTDFLYEEAKRVFVPGHRNIALESAKIAGEAPHLISVWNMKHFSSRLKKIEGLIGEDFRQNYERAELASIGCAIENMWLMAHNLGLGMVWLMASLSSVKKCQEKFGLNGEIVAYLPLGYPLNSNTVVKKKRKALSDICAFYSTKEDVDE